MEQDQNTSLFQLNLDASNSYTLRSAASWARVLGIVGIIMAILFFVFAVMFQTAMSKSGSSRYYGEDFGGGASLVGNMGMIVYIIVGLLYLIGSVFALNFGNKTSRALKTNDQSSLNAGFAAARNYFAFWAILLIIALLFLLIGLAGFAAGS